MKASEIRNKSDSELQNELESLRKAQFNLRMQQGMGQMPRPHEFSRLRKDIARIKTVLSERRRASHAE